MSIPINDLTENDYLILEYINNFSSVSEEQIKQHFDGKIDAIEYRLSILKKAETETIANTMRVSIPNSSYIIEEHTPVVKDFVTTYVSKNSFHISQLGKAVLQDYLIKKKTNKKNMLLTNIWIPIAVTLITNLIVDGVKWLLPLIQQWITNIQK